MTHTLRALRHKPTLLLNTMDVFIKEPHLEWKNDAIKQAEAMRKEGGIQTLCVHVCMMVRL